MGESSPTMDAEKLQHPPPSTAASLIAGSFGGACQVIVGQPLDTIKTRAQTSPRGMFKGPLDIATQTIRKEGVLALYKGMASPLIGVAGVNSLLFAAYGQAKHLVSPYPELSLPQTALAGSMAGAANALLASPVEMFKIRMQGQYGQPTDKKLSKVLSEMWNTWGFRRGIMRGFWVTVVKEIPAYGGFYLAYEFSKRQFQKRHGPSTELPVWALLASGASGGALYWTLCYPLDVVKSRVQLADKPPNGANYIANTFSDPKRSRYFCRVRARHQVHA
ncbi:uncharacterized protein L969DRAFT_94303 [Mixia osmundae IAM 14324]|uniref:Mitochondrial carrier n=1 Tax=Mixia osmundae (strain CBS 9802 / IAM 14324 / JCM 22182 / KY 12970) TaxID=764103 RepID=G7E8G5_MIXOS|nr:uncharacterized protein L969DRAFT_94303 [Mixia osmundae IAM 14324]KEI39227.1 hypothetical protein L969DRAFT_94303 [Mixia osmundae IAM 14324]GAA99125.1 hypothetical protein E5Q_05815 [Mixia osmundae IAM 14324]